MIQRHFVATLLLAIVALVTSAAPAVAVGDDSDDVLEFQLVVRVGAGHTIGEVIDALSPFMLSIEVDEDLGDNRYLVEFVYNTGSDANDLWAVVIGLWSDGVIVWGENNLEAQAPEGRTDSLWFTGLPIGQPQFDSQYAPGLIGSDLVTPMTSGAGVRIAVIDTGMDLSHPMFASGVDPGWDFLGGTLVSGDPADFFDNDGDGVTDEMAGHGTFVASLIRRVARDATIVPIRILNSDGRGHQANLAAAIDWAVADGARVINLSLGSNGSSTAVEESLANAKAAGVIVICAIGNNGDAINTQYPATDLNTFSVAATDPMDLLAPFSSFGVDVDVAAPGATMSVGDIPVVGQSIIGAIPGGGFAIWEGTSFSAALVSGMAATVLAQHPEWPGAGMPADQVADAVMAIITGTAVDIDELNPAQAGQIGAGRVDAYSAALASPIAPVATDLNQDGLVDGGDLALFLADWGNCLPGACPSDINRDGAIDGADLSILFADWG